jgi:hypothetical protein
MEGEHGTLGAAAQTERRRGSAYPLGLRRMKADGPRWSGRDGGGGTGLVGLQPGLVACQGQVGGLGPGRLIWAERRWQIFYGVRIHEGKAVFQKYAFVARTRVPSGARRTRLAGQLGRALRLCNLGYE